MDRLELTSNSTCRIIGLPETCSSVFTENSSHSQMYFVWLVIYSLFIDYPSALYLHVIRLLYRISKRLVVMESQLIHVFIRGSFY